MEKVRFHGPFDSPLHHLTEVDESDSTMLKDELNHSDCRDNLRALWMASVSA